MIKLKELLQLDDIDSIINAYIKASDYDILGDWGSCGFYTRDLFNFCKNKYECKIAYMPASIVDVDEKNHNKLQNHIVPIVKNLIVDFAYVPNQGVDKEYRTGNPPTLQIGKWPLLTKFNPGAFKRNGVYGKLGYLSKSKYGSWEYTDYPWSEKLKAGEYPIILDSFPESYVGVEEPIKKRRVGN